MTVVSLMSSLDMKAVLSLASVSMYQRKVPNQQERVAEVVVEVEEVEEEEAVAAVERNLMIGSVEWHQLMHQSR